MLSTGTPKRTVSQSPLKVTQCFAGCGATVHFRTTPRIICDDCKPVRRAEQARQVAERKRRKRGIPKVKGTIVPCDRCAADIVRRSRTHRFCETCAPIAALELANRIATAKRRADGLEAFGTKLTCANCKVEFIKNHPRHFYCADCQKLQKAGALPSLRASFSAWRRRQYRDNPKFALNERMRRGILRSLGSKKSGRSWESLVGYTASDLMKHLERQFLPDMNWENRALWEIDHIIPLSLFSFDSAEHPDFKEAWALTNLRPLWAEENYDKRAKRTFLI